MRSWIVAAAALTCSFTATQALACGACVTRPGPPGPANPAYVAQKAERIFFGFDPATKRSVAWVEIRYTGQPEDFGWVVPMPKKPTIGVGATYLFDRLDQATAPRLTMKVGPNRENCRVPQQANSGGGFGCAEEASVLRATSSGGSGANLAADTSNGGRGKVVVVEQSTIGPYSYAVLASTDSGDLVKWLNDNSYVTPKEATPIIDAHLKKGDVFVALKLLNNKGIDAIRPVTFTMDDADPCVPLRLTSIAAVEDMEVIVYLAGPGRGMPKNHLHVQVNPYRLAWENGGGNYGQVLATAMDEAAGRAFATEFAGPTKGLAVAGPPSDVAAMSLQFGRPVDVGQLASAYLPGELVAKGRLDASAFAEVTTTAQLAAALKKSQFLLADEVQATLDRYVLGPNASKGVSWANVQVTGSFDAVELPNPATKVDGKSLAAELSLFAGGLKDAVGLIEAQPTLTRLSMRISPKEMTRDPLFAFHPKLPEVNSNWSATLSNVCVNGDNTDNGARLQITGRKESHIIRNGHAGFTTFQTVAATVKTALEPRFAKMPAAAVVEVLDEALPAMPVPPAQIELVDLAIGLAVPGAPTLPKDFVLKPAEPRLVVPASDPNLDTVTAANSAAADPGGCKLGHHGRAVSAFALVALALLTVLAVRRRPS